MGMGPEFEEAEAKAKAAAGVNPSLHITVRALHGIPVVCMHGVSVGSEQWRYIAKDIAGTT